MRPVLTCLLALAACAVGGVAPAPAAAATHEPRSAAAFRDSVGVTTHVAYYETAYGDWPRVVDLLEDLGVRHLRDGAFGNPAPQWRDWNERYYRAVELAAARGMRFTFLMGRPGNEGGSLDDLVGVVGGRLRGATEALEAPNEFDHARGGPTWPTALRSYTRSLYRKANAHPALRSLPVVGPSLYGRTAPERVGDQRSWLDLGNVHPYTGGRSPEPDHVKAELARASAVSGAKPVWATEAGFHNALKAGGGHPPVSERAAAVYHVRTFLEHFEKGIARTYAYELLDEKPEGAGRDPEQHFGLVRNDFSPKPAYAAVRNLLRIVGPAREPERLRPLRMSLGGTGGVRHLVLQKADGRHLVALWRLDSIWDRGRRRELSVTPRRVSVRLPDAGGLTVADPLKTTEGSPVSICRGSAAVMLGADPLLLEVSPRREGHTSGCGR